MYQAKNLGRNRFVIFDVSMRNQLIDEIELESEFRDAFKFKRFNACLQPIIDIESDAVLYYESTIEWHSERSGLIKGADLWKLANQCGLAYSVNQHLMDITFEQLNLWQSNPQQRHVKVGMSLSIEHLMHKSSMQNLVQAIEQANFDSELLVIELSEESLSKFSKYLPTILDQLHRLGVTLVLDNFGSATASLSYFFTYDFDFIKLSESLVNTLGMSDKYHTLVKSVVEIADNLGISVIGDGVSDEQTRHELQMIGCRYAQGDFIRPTQTR